MAAVDERLARVEVQVQEHSQGFLTLRDSIGRLEGRIDHLEGRIDRFEERVDARFASVEQRFDRRFDALDHRLSSLFNAQIATFVALLGGAGGIIAALLSR